MDDNYTMNLEGLKWQRTKVVIPLY